MLRARHRMIDLQILSQTPFFTSKDLEPSDYVWKTLWYGIHLVEEKRLLVLFTLPRWDRDRGESRFLNTTLDQHEHGNVP